MNSLHNRLKQFLNYIIQIAIIGTLVIEVHCQTNLFDDEIEVDHYKHAIRDFENQKLKGSIKEVINYSESGINLHLRLNKKGEITNQYVYVDSSRLFNAIYYKEKRIIKSIEYPKNQSNRYIFYHYDKRGNLLRKDFSNDRKNRSQTHSFSFLYDNNNRILVQNLDRLGQNRFIYESDSLAWKLLYKDSILKNVTSRHTNEHQEKIVQYLLDSTSAKPFRERIKPKKVYYIKKGSDKEEKLNYDSGNLVTDTKKYRFEYDAYNNWVVKELLAKSVTTIIRRGDKTVKRNTAIEKRIITYFD